MVKRREGSLKVREFFWKRRRLVLGFVVTCTVSFASLAVLWQNGPVVEAAILDPRSVAVV